MWKSDNELFALMKTWLFTAVVGDILDTLGYMHQFVSPAIKPLDVNTVVAGGQCGAGVGRLRNQIDVG